jgi:hypothetical protein
MKRKDYWLIVFLLILAGLVGGSITSWLLQSSSAIAQQKKQPERVIKAQAFYLVDKEGKIRASLDLLGGNPRLELIDKDGKIIWSAPSEARLAPLH